MNLAIIKSKISFNIVTAKNSNNFNENDTRAVKSWRTEQSTKNTESCRHNSSGSTQQSCMRSEERTSAILKPDHFDIFVP